MFWILAVVLTGMKNYFCKFGTGSNITNNSGTSLLITQPEYYCLLLIQELSWNLEVWVLSVRMENIWTTTALIPDFKISFRYSLYLLSEVTAIVLLCLVAFETQRFIRKYNPKPNHLQIIFFIWDTLLKLLMPEYVWHFNVDISHNKIPVLLFMFIATQIAFSIPEIHSGKQLKFWMGTSLPDSALIWCRLDTSLLELLFSCTRYSSPVTLAGPQREGCMCVTLCSASLCIWKSTCSSHPFFPHRTSI